MELLTTSFISIAKLLEARSEHPLAKAVVNYDYTAKQNDYSDIISIDVSNAVAGNGLKPVHSILKHLRRTVQIFLIKSAYTAVMQII